MSTVVVAVAVGCTTAVAAVREQKLFSFEEWMLLLYTVPPDHRIMGLGGG
jgi:hypothetical protein